MRKVATAITAALIVALGMTSCTSGPATREPAQSSSPTVAPTVDRNAKENATIESFVSAAWQSRFDEATQYASPGSAAERYVVHQQAVTTAYNANGEGQIAPEEQPTLTFADGEVTIAQNGSPDTYTLTDFSFDKDGLVTSWTGKSGPVANALWTQPWTGQTGGNTVDLVSAYKANSGGLFVVLKVTANDRATEPYSYSATYSASDGITHTVAAASQPQNIAAGSAGYVILTFDGAPFGGTVNLDGASPDDYSLSWAVAVPVA